MRTECNTCIHRFKNNRFCTKDDKMIIDENLIIPMCALREIDWKVKRNNLKEEFSEEFKSRLEERQLAKITHEEDFYTFLKKGGAWSLDPRNPGKINLKEK